MPGRKVISKPKSNHIQLWVKEYKLGVEVYSYRDCFDLYAVIDESDNEIQSLPDKTNLKFKYSSTGEHKYYTSDGIKRYKYPSDEAFKCLITDIIKLLNKSIEVLP